MNNAEFEKCFLPMRQKLYRTALMYLGSEAMALDAVDESVYRALRSVGKLRNVEYFETWLTKILINVCVSELRRQKRFVPLEDVPEESAEDYDSLPLKDAIAKLPCQLREVILLRYFSEFTLKQTARVLDIPLGTASTRQRRALELLRLELGEEGEI